MKKICSILGLLLCVAILVFSVTCIRIVPASGDYMVYCKYLVSTPAVGDTVMVPLEDGWTIKTVIGTPGNEAAVVEYSANLPESTEFVMATASGADSLPDGYVIVCYEATDSYGKTFAIAGAMQESEIWGHLVWTLHLVN